MDFDQLKYFISIAQSRNFTAAAKVHHITQPAISRRIDSLEKEVGCRLLVRDSHKVMLTDAGQEFFDYAVSVMNMTDASQQRMENIARGRVGRVRISLVPSCAHAMRSAIIEFHHHYPMIQLDIDYHTGKEQISSIIQRKHDFYFSFETLANAQSELNSLVTDTDHYELLVPSAHSFRADADDLSTLNDLPLLTESRGDAPFFVPKVLEICSSRGFYTENRITCNSFTTMIDFANAGIGFTLIPHAMERSICTDYLVPFRLHGEDVQNPNTVSWFPDALNDTTVLFRNVCRELFK